MAEKTGSYTFYFRGLRPAADARRRVHDAWFTVSQRGTHVTVVGDRYMSGGGCSFVFSGEEYVVVAKNSDLKRIEADGKPIWSE